MSAYREYRPAAALRPYVDCCWTSDVVADGSPLRILPDGCIDFLWSIDKTGAEGKIVGAMTEATLFSPHGRVRIAAVRFKPGGAAPFLPCPAAEVTDAEAPLTAPALADALAEATSAAARAGRLEEALIALLPHSPAPDARATHAARLLATGSTVTDSARAVGVSRQYLNRLFSREVGLGPKGFARIMRLQRLRGLRLGGAGWATAALEAGYSDQAHLIRECRALAGVAPTELA